MSSDPSEQTRMRNGVAPSLVTASTPFSHPYELKRRVRAPLGYGEHAGTP